MNAWPEQAEAESFRDFIGRTAAGAGPDLAGELRLDFDATITVAYSEKENGHLRRGPSGFTRCCASWTARRWLAGLLRPGNAGSNTVADHVRVLEMALASLLEQARPRPGDPTSPRLLARSDSVGATHAFAAACVQRGLDFSFGFPGGQPDPGHRRPGPRRVLAPGDPDRRKAARRRLGWPRPPAWSTGRLAGWPDGSRLILRKERPHPGAQRTFTDVDGLRVTAVLTNTPAAAARSISALALNREAGGLAGHSSRCYRDDVDTVRVRGSTLSAPAAPTHQTHSPSHQGPQDQQGWSLPIAKGLDHLISQPPRPLRGRTSCLAHAQRRRIARTPILAARATPGDDASLPPTREFTVCGDACVASCDSEVLAEGGPGHASGPWTASRDVRWRCRRSRSKGRR
jgi:hypothetical protein